MKAKKQFFRWRKERRLNNNKPKLVHILEEKLVRIREAGYLCFYILVSYLYKDLSKIIWIHQKHTPTIISQEVEIPHLDLI